MLTAGSEYGMNDHSARQRIKAWLSSSIGPYAPDAAAGAAAGRAFASDNTGDQQRLDVINDPGWLAARYDTTRAAASR